MSLEKEFDEVVKDLEQKIKQVGATALEKQMFLLLLRAHHRITKLKQGRMSDIDIMRMRAMAKTLPINQVADLFDVSPNFAYKVVTNRVRTKPKNIGQLCKDLYGSVESIVDTGKHIS